MNEPALNQEDIKEPDQLEPVPESQEKTEPKDPEQKTNEAEDPEALARKLGWKPKEEYGGNAEHWVPVDEFLERAENDPKHLKKSLRALQRNYERLEKTTEAIYAHTERQVQAAQKEGYEKAMDEVEARMQKAMEDGDSAAMNEAIADRDKVIAEANKAETQYSENDANARTEWEARNPWFGTDPVLSDAAARYTGMLAEQGKTAQEQLEAVDKYIRETFPQKFPEEQRRRAPAMNGSGQNAVRRNVKPKPGTYEAMSQEYKNECDRFVRDCTARRNVDEKTARAEWMKFSTDDMFQN